MKRLLLLLALLAFSAFGSVSYPQGQVTVGAPSGTRTQGGTPDPVPCLPNNVIPAGHKSCVGSDGRTWVAPPPPQPGASRGVIVPPPPASNPRVTPNEPNPSNTEKADKTAPADSDSTSVWWTVGGVAAITALLGAVAALINAIRGRK